MLRPGWGGKAHFTMWSLDFAKNPLDFVSNSSDFATDSSDFDKRLFGGNLKSVDIGWGRLGNQLNIEVLHLLGLPEDAEVGISPWMWKLGCWGPLNPAPYSDWTLDTVSIFGSE